MASARDRVVYSNLEFFRVLTPDTLHNHIFPQPLSSSKLSEIRNGSFSGLNLHENLHGRRCRKRE